MDISFSDTKSLFFSKLFLVVKEFINLFNVYARGVYIMNVMRYNGIK